MSSLDWDSTKRKLAAAAEVGRDAGVTKSLKAGGRAALDATAERTTQVMAAAQALLASDLSSDLNNLVAAAVKGSATIYDKAMDANYLDPLLRPGLGGSYHRLFDGGHTIAGAVRAARDASPMTPSSRRRWEPSRRCSETPPPPEACRSRPGTRAPSTR